jgi:hypothetical protein
MFAGDVIERKAYLKALRSQPLYKFSMGRLVILELLTLQRGY